MIKSMPIPFPYWFTSPSKYIFHALSLMSKMTSFGKSSLPYSLSMGSWHKNLTWCFLWWFSLPHALNRILLVESTISIVFHSKWASQTSTLMDPFLPLSIFGKIGLLGHMCFSCYRTYVMILCNWLILWQNALYLYLGRLRMCLNT